MAGGVGIYPQFYLFTYLINKHIVLYMPIVACKLCRKKFYTKPNWIKMGNGKYCSLVCARTASRRGKTVNCFQCDKKTYKSLKSLRSSKSKKYFCGKKCSLEWLNAYQFGKNHKNWKHGQTAYKTILIRGSILAFCCLCGKKDKRILLVHHVDENRKNNEIHNLTWLCYNCHFLVHHYENVKNKLLKKHAYC